jgi:hypothetical protein
LTAIDQLTPAYWSACTADDFQPPLFLGLRLAVLRLTMAGAKILASMPNERGFKITLFLADGMPGGIRVVEKSN